MIKKYLSVLIFISIVALAHAQSGKVSSSLNFEGQIGISTNAKAVLLSIGGATLKYNFSKFALAINFGPNLK